MTKASASKPVPSKRLNQEQTDCFNAIYCREKKINMAFKRASSEMKKKNIRMRAAHPL